MRTSGVLLVGGESKRFFQETGEYKQFTRFKGKPLVYYGLRVLIRSTDEVIISTSMRFKDQIHEVKDQYFADHDIRIIFDSPVKNIGPFLASRKTVLKATYPYVVIIPGDSPNISEAIVQALLRRVMPYKSERDVKQIQRKCPMASVMDKQGNPYTLLFALDRERHPLFKKLGEWFIMQKQVWELPLRMTDYFLMTPCIELLECNELPINVNHLRDLERLKQINQGTRFSILTRKSRVVKSKLLLRIMKKEESTRKEMIHVLKEQYKNWEKTILAIKIKKDLERLSQLHR